MPHNLVRIAVAARDPTPSTRLANAATALAGDDDAVVEETVNPADDFEARWLRRLAVVLDAPGENVDDACALTPSAARAARLSGREDVRGGPVAPRHGGA